MSRPVKKEILEQIKKEFNQNAPCAHENYENIGLGYYVKCHDCNRDVPVEFLDRAKEAYEYHETLAEHLHQAFNELIILRGEAVE